MSRRDVYSPPDNNYDALLIDAARRATIARKPIRTGKSEHGIGGFYALLLDGRNNGGMKDLHPRSAVGVSRDGRYLILMVIDGRQTGYSEGATTAETAEWMREMGAHNALNLDGGGSTTLVIEEPDGGPKLLNRPSGQFQRLVANHLGVFARPLTHPPATQPASSAAE
jgi:exopolysaccharide biosynthesis protein